MSLLKEDFRFWLRRQSAWCDLRQSLALGGAEAMRRMWTWPRILRTPPVVTNPVEPGSPLELHTMCHRGDWLLAIWMLKSFFHHSGNRPSLVIHCQNELKPSAEAHLRRHFPSARIVTPAESNETVTDYLIRRGLPRCLHWRREMGVMQKLLDVQVLAGGVNVLGLDADILFFQRPAELLAAGASPANTFTFQRDCADSYTINRDTARLDLGVALAPCVNTGIVLRAASALNLVRVEEFLSHPRVARRSGHLEQTLHALCASETGRVNYLPATYGLSMEGKMPLRELVCRHYAGASRRWITKEGMNHLKTQGLLEAGQVGRSTVTQLGAPDIPR